MNENKLNKQEITDTIKLTKEFNERLLNKTRKSFLITNFSVMKDDIKNYRPLNEIQLTQLESLTEIEKIEIIKLYNIILSSIEELIN